MKVFLKNQIKLNPKTVEFYYANFDIVDDEKKADLIVINDFNPINSDKIVACNSTATDHITAKEIIDLKGEDLSDLTAVPELCLAMAIYCQRIFKNEEVKGKTLGIIGGQGRIGRKFAEMARAVGMNVIYYDKTFKKSDLDFLLENSDVVSLHITASEENRDFFKKEHFEKMKDGIFLNSARPYLVEELGLVWALDNKLAGAWIDFNMPFTHSKLIITPHIGGGTIQSRAKSELILAKKLKKYVGSRQTDSQ